MRTLLTSLTIIFCISISAQQKDIPVQINLKDGTSLDAKHFGKLKCGKNSYSENFIYVRGKYQGSVTEIKDYSKIEKIVLEGFNAEPVSSVGNEKAVVRVYRKSGVSIALDEAEIFMTCYAAGDKYNQIVVQFINPVTDEAQEKEISTKDIQSVIFK
jgi:hypothetical protein